MTVGGGYRLFYGFIFGGRRGSAEKDTPYRALGVVYNISIYREPCTLCIISDGCGGSKLMIL